MENIVSIFIFSKYFFNILQGGNMQGYSTFLISSFIIFKLITWVKNVIKYIFSTLHQVQSQIYMA